VPGVRLVIDRLFSASYCLENPRDVFSRPTVSDFEKPKIDGA
jgi:hypothetical protein